MSNKCRIIKISKGNGKFRTIYDPGPEMRSRISTHFSGIRDVMMAACDYRTCHGFMPGRSPATNACYHVNYQYTLSMDLKDFFDTVNETHLLSRFAKHILDECLLDGIARQGLPTSPMFANIAAAEMDEKISRVALGLGVQYTRYADDLTLSGNEYPEMAKLSDTIGAIVNSCGFTVNESKTRLQSAKSGRRRITGLTVDDAVHVPRELRRKSRAAKHQGHMGSAAGLIAWAGSPGWVCPICWHPGAHNSSFSSLVHFKRPYPTHWGKARYSWERPTEYLESLKEIHGGIIEWAGVYDEMRAQYVAQSMA